MAFYLNINVRLFYRMAAKSILQVAERVEKALIEAEGIQKDVEDGIMTTNQNIVDATNSLSEVSIDFLLF